MSIQALQSTRPSVDGWRRSLRSCYNVPSDSLEVRASNRAIPLRLRYSFSLPREPNPFHTATPCV